MILTMAAVAAAKKMPAYGFSVRVRLQTDDGSGGGEFVSQVCLSSRYSVREQRILFNSARSCEVHHLLQGPLEFREELLLSTDLEDR